MAKEYLYRQISSQLRQDILTGKYLPDDMIPSENELAAKYHTSRVTIRKSLQVLEGEGLIKPWHGKGYFVQRPAYTSFTLHFSDGGGQYATKFQQITIIPADKALSQALCCEENTMLVVTRRVMEERDARPVAYDEKFVIYKKGTPSVEMEINYAEFPEIFADKITPVSIRTEMEIGIEEGPDYVCKALGCPQKTMFLTVYRTVLTKEGERIGYGRQFLSQGYGRIKAYAGYYDEP